MPPEFLTIENLCRYYVRGSHTVKAVDKVSFTINRGEFVAIVGSSGSGKSTILNLLAGLDTATSGEVAFEGKHFSKMSRKEIARYRAEQVGMVFQSFNLITHFDAAHNVAMALYFNHTPKKERLIKAKEMLTSLGMEERVTHKPADLSGGEQQRVAIARALVKQPSILFADEPTGNLDRENSVQISELLKKLNEDGLTIVMVTHDLPLARQYARRIIRMDYGLMIDDGPVKKSEGENL